MKIFLYYIVAIIFLFLPLSTYAYTTNMDASVVIGQSDFTSNSVNAGGSVSAHGYDYPYCVDTDGTHMVVSEYNNNRVLIYNSIPSSNTNPNANVVVGQSNFTNHSANQGGSVGPNTLNQAGCIKIIGNKLLIADYGNNRVLIYNSIPTNNNASADVVIGQPDMVTSSSGTTASKSTGAWQMDYDPSTGKLFIVDYGNSRILIYNSIPTTNGASANLVIGQSDFFHGDDNGGGSVSASTVSSPWSVHIFNGKMLVTDYDNSRILIWNTIPTAIGTSADVVIGQKDFISSDTNQGGSVGANTLQYPTDTAYDGRHLFVMDYSNARILVFNGIPTSNNASAYMVLGQTDLLAAADNSSNPTSHTIDYSDGLLAVKNNQLFVADSGNHRILIFNDIIKEPNIGSSISLYNVLNDLIRFTGTVTADVPYVVSTVEYSINGGGFSNASPSDGFFNSAHEGYTFDFNSKANGVKESDYTVRVRSTNNNLDTQEHLFYFSHFTPSEPANNSFTTNELPTFGFTVNHERFSDLKDNLSKFQIEINREESEWQTYIDEIPVEYEAIKNRDNNLQKGSFSSYGNGLYEDKKIWIRYSNDNATIMAYAKNIDSSNNPTNKYFDEGGKRLRAGVYTWRVVALDKKGHRQESSVNTVKINTKSYIRSDLNKSSTVPFSLGILSITGLGNINVTSYNLSSLKTSYTTWTTTPTIYGIANAGAHVSLTAKEKTCKEIDTAVCSKVFVTTANNSSRYGINIPKNTFEYNKTYSISLSSSLGDQYTEFPPFYLRVGN